MSHDLSALHFLTHFLAQDPGIEPAPLQPVDTNTVGQQGPGFHANDFSFWSLFMRADLVGKSVIVILIVASFWSWAIIFDKWWRYSSLGSKADRFEAVFWSGKSLDDLYQNLGAKPDHPMATVFVAAMREWRRSFEAGTVTQSLAPSIRQRLDKVMSVTISRELTSAERYLSFLATVGSTAPFVGLFGTVWGIMNSFRAIAGTHNTSLDVVAPGIAEALFATALGLLAAIPAVIFYNSLSTKLSRYSSRLEGFADEFSAILSRQLDERAR
ncbi:MAG: protein TolQ [Alphaproteobacteria bacterium]|nr:protein TolQ [Alphaproteobacteria bacterium]